MEPSAQIRLVRENLALAISMGIAAKKGLINAGFMPNRSEIETDNGDVLSVSSSLAIRDTQDLVRCSNNQVRGSFASSAVQANRILQEGGVRRDKRKQKVDKMAAAILLQSYLDASA